MSDIKSIARQAVVEAITAYSLKGDSGKKIAGAGIIFLAGYIILSGILVLGFALYLWLEPEFGAAQSALWSGLFFILLSAIMILASARFMQSGKAHKEIQIRHQAEQIADLLTEDVIDELRRPVCENPKTAVALAAIAGYVAGGRLK
jgi:hypothetical protein